MDYFRYAPSLVTHRVETNWNAMNILLRRTACGNRASNKGFNEGNNTHCEQGFDESIRLLEQSMGFLLVSVPLRNQSLRACG
jgi:hypothetical protein